MTSVVNDKEPLIFDEGCVDYVNRESSRKNSVFTKINLFKFDRQSEEF